MDLYSGGLIIGRIYISPKHIQHFKQGPEFNPLSFDFLCVFVATVIITDRSPPTTFTGLQSQ